ncbi:hypothetical protein [Mesorhizobium huakuii]|uniref:hypothetical protein n=1 Tax=Mesorhizobium huakuii TaxID=28104 RepID=UPI001FD27FCC|nr:hypothetical protein [Mesorhizobium huakuii]
MGARFKFRFLNGGELSIETSRTIEGSPGVNGGGMSPVQLLVQEYQDGRREIIGGPRPDGTWRSPLLSSHKFGPGDAFEFLSTGGGGWGVALSRDPERVREDVIDGYVSHLAARRDYGVALDPNTFELLHDETSKLRNLA